MPHCADPFADQDVEKPHDESIDLQYTYHPPTLLPSMLNGQTAHHQRVPLRLFWRPAAIASYSAGRFSGVRAGTAWHAMLSEMGMVVISSTLAVGPIAQTLDEHGQPTGSGGDALQKAFPRFADDLAWWTEAAREQRARKAPPY